MIDTEFWSLAAKKGLSWFRFFRRSISVKRIDRELGGTVLEREWLSLKLKMQPHDKIWPFEFHIRNYLGMRKGYIVLRRGKPIGGIVTALS